MAQLQVVVASVCWMNRLRLGLLSELSSLCRSVLHWLLHCFCEEDYLFVSICLTSGPSNHPTRQALTQSS